MRAYAFWLLMFCLLPLIVRRPIIGLTTYCILNVTRPELFFWGGDQGAKSLIIVFGATVLGMLVNAEIDISAVWQPHILLTLWVYAAIETSMWMATYLTPMAPKYSAEVFKVWVLCLVATMLLKNLRRLDILLTGILLSSTFLALWGIDQYFRGNTRLEGLGGDSMGDSNYIAAHFVLFMPLAVQRALHAPNRNRFLLAVFCCLAIVGVILCTESRGGLLGLLAGTGLLVMTSEKKAKLIPFLVIIVLILAPIFITDQYKERVGTMTGEEELDSSAESRLVLWECGWRIFLDKPVFGCGFGNFPWEKNLYEHHFMDLEDWFRKYVFEKPKVTHSTVFQVLSEGGCSWRSRSSGCSSAPCGGTAARSAGRATGRTSGRGCASSPRCTAG